MRYSTSEIADAVARGLQQRAADDDDEQAVYGFDALDELGLHPVIQQALEHTGWGVFAEQRYPEEREKDKRSEGRRCDVVLTDTGLPLRDPLIKNTLFDAAPATDPQEAYWLEIKTVAQHETGGPFRRYSQELLGAVAQDVKKIWSDGLIFHGGLLVVLFTESQRVAEHDLLAWHHRCVDKGFPVAPPATRHFKITDRIGNGCCSVACFGVRGV